MVVGTGGAVANAIKDRNGPKCERLGCVFVDLHSVMNTGCSLERSLLSLRGCVSYGVFGLAEKLEAHLLVIGPAVTFHEIWCAMPFLITSYSCIESCASLLVLTCSHSLNNNFI